MSRHLRHRAITGALAVLVTAGASLAAAVAGGTTSQPGAAPALLPGPPRSEARMAIIYAYKERASRLPEQFAKLRFTDERGEVMPYRLFTPEHLEPGRRYPLVVFLHGAAGSGSDNERQLQGGNVYGALVWALPENQARHPAFIVAPQTDVNWPCVILEPGQRPVLCPGLGMGAAMAFKIIDKLTADLPIDTDRIYVTGHSMGGAGTWHLIAERPTYFAAAVPVCGLPDFSTAPIIKDLPIWNFHGDADPVEPVATSRRMIDAIVKAGGHPLHTEYPGIEHPSFAWAYTEPALVEWVFAQRRGRPANGDLAALSARHHDSVVDSLVVFAYDSLLFEPGVRFSYSTYGWTLLSAALRRAHGTPFLDAARDRATGPFGLRDTGPEIAGRVAPSLANPYEIDSAGRPIAALTLEAVGR